MTIYSLQVGFKPSHFNLLLLQFVHALCILWRLSFVIDVAGRVCNVICLVRTSERANDRLQNEQLTGVSKSTNNLYYAYTCGLSFLSIENLATDNIVGPALTSRVYVADEVLISTEYLLTIIAFVLLTFCHYRSSRRSLRFRCVNGRSKNNADGGFFK